jgi:ribosomal protein L29
MKKTQTLSKNLNELRKNLVSSKKELRGLILDNTQFKLKDNRQIFHKRKEIARILTSIREMELVK